MIEQEQKDRFTITVRELIENWQKYGNFLDFQREEVWSHNKERSWIEGLLHGYPLVEFPVVKLGEGKYAFIDGKQRILTLRRFVIEKAFTTFKDKANPPYGSVDPNKFYDQLLQQYQEMIMNSVLALHVIGEMEEWVQADYYRWLQNNQPLNLPERVWTYPSEAKRQAIKLLEHDFWRDIYQGSQSRMHPFLGCYYIMLLEVTPAANMDRRRLVEFASGVNDKAVNTVLIEKIQRRLDRAKHVFYGLTLKNVKEVIPVYQAIDLLETAKFDLEAVPRGCLTSWYRDVQENANATWDKYHVRDDLFKMTHVNYRDLFWDHQQQSVIEAVKSYWKGGKKGETKPNPLQGIDLQTVVNKQEGLCPSCDRAIENVFGGDYVLQYKKGNPLTQENCAVVHKACHQRLLQTHPEIDLEAVDITEDMRKTE